MACGHQWADVEKASDASATADHEEDFSASKPEHVTEIAGYGLNAISQDIEKRPADSTTADDPGLPPDGGWGAWIQVLMAHIIIFNTWGYINSFGVFQVFHVQHLHRPPSDISWVGSIQIFLLFSIGTVSGRASDAGYFKQTFAAGLLMQLIGLFMTSLSKTYWQLFLAQGICTGIGNGLLFCPSLAVLTTYFLKRRGIAVGVAACGTATGGVVFPSIAQHLLPRIGFGWTVRIMGFIMLVTMIFPLLIMRSRLPPRTTGPLVELAAFKEVPYLLFAIGNSLCFLGLYFVIYYVSCISPTVHQPPLLAATNLPLDMR
jgi:MFS family permease